MPFKSDHKFTDGQIDHIVKMYVDSKLSVREIADILHITPATLSTYIKSKGVPVINKQAKPFPICACGCGEVLTDRRAKYKRGHGPYQPFRGHTHTAASKSKISLGVQKAIKDDHHYQKRFYYKYGDKQIAMRSAWEVDVAEWLSGLKTKWLYEHKSFVLSTGSSYTPDFFLPEFDCYIEVKGFWYEDARVKTKLFRQEYPEETLFIVRDVGVFGKIMLSQKIFEKLLGLNVDKMTEEDRIKFVKEQALMLYAEISEVLQEVPWKDHKQYIDRKIDRGRYLEELTDVFVFVTNMFAALNFDEFEICSALENVVTKNFTRQRIGYIGTTGEDLSGWKDYFTSSIRKNAAHVNRKKEQRHEEDI